MAQKNTLKGAEWYQSVRASVCDRRHGRSSVFILALFIPTAAAQLPTRACRVAGLAEEVRCATVEVPEDRAARNGRTIGLRVVVLPSRAQMDGPRHTLFYLVGGPGLAATPLADLIASAHAATRATHDIVLVDQRGTGGSNPLRCALYGTSGDVAAYLGDQFPVDSVRACVRRLRSRANLTQYTTGDAAQDLESVRARLGVDRIDIDASAYGTRVALAYARAYPERIRSMVLQGVVPEEEVLPLTAAHDAQRALDRVFADCAADPFCRTSFPTLRREFAALLTRFGDSALSIRAQHPRSDDSVTLALTPGVFADRLRIMLYSARLSRRIPAVIHRAYEGDWTPFTTLAYELSRAVFDQLDAGAHLAVQCTDDLDHPDPGRGTFLGEYRARLYRDACAELNQPTSTHGRNPPLRVTALLVTGELDPVTPPRFAQSVAKQMPSATVLTVPGMAHAGADRCVEGVISAFIAAGARRGVDTSCVTKIVVPPFITR
jgi:pimeloyl-ACP methyl ester carboxylesterase